MKKIITKLKGIDHMQKYFIYLGIIVYAIESYSLPLQPSLPITTQEQYNMQVLESVQPVVVKFEAPWCAVCQSITKACEEIKHDPEFCNTITFVDINIDEAPVLSEQHNIQGIPTFKFIEHGRIIDHDEVGVKNVGDFKETLCNRIRTAFEIKNNNNEEPTIYVRPDWQNKIIQGGKQFSMVVREWTRKSITTTLSYTTYFLDWIKYKVDVWLC